MKKITARSGRHNVAQSPLKDPNAKNPSRQKEVPAVRKATAILEHLARHADGQGVSRIARDLGIIPSTCLHILRELSAAHLVSFEPNGKIYRLGLGVLDLARQLSRHDPFIQSVQPQLNAFAQRHGTSISAQQRDEAEVVIVAAVAASEGLEAPIGRRLPCLSAAGGKLFASHTGWSPKLLKEHFNRVRWQNPPAFSSWMQEVRLAEQGGVAVDEGRFRLGITSIAAGIRDREGAILRAISVNIVSAQLDAKRRATLVAALRDAAGAIGSTLRY